MAFDFPDAPAVGDEYVSGGATYTWTGLVWDLGGMNAPADFVEKTGDTMTGTLFGTNIRSIGDGTVGQLWMSAGDTTRTGNLEWRMVDGARQAYMGWALKSDWISFKTEDSCKGLYMTGGADLFMGDNSGIHWGNTSAQTDVNNFSEGICLYGYGSTSQFGLNVTSGTLNLSVQNAANKVDVNVGGATQLRIQQGTSHMYSNFECAGTITAKAGVNVDDGDQVDFSNNYHIVKVFGAATMQLHCGQNGGNFKFHISGFGDAYMINSVGATGNSFSATAPDAVATAAELGVADDPERGVDLMKVIAALLLKVKALEARVKRFEDL